MLYCYMESRRDFITFTWYRACLCGVLLLTLIFFAVFGQSLFYYYFGSGNKFIYKKGAMAVHFVDVGHGDCTIVQLPDGKIAVIDGGHVSQTRRLNNYIRTRIKPKRNKIHYVIKLITTNFLSVF